jgi:hypothetical protein
MIDDDAISELCRHAEIDGEEGGGNQMAHAGEPRRDVIWHVMWIQYGILRTLQIAVASMSTSGVVEILIRGHQSAMIADVERWLCALMLTLHIAFTASLSRFSGGREERDEMRTGAMIGTSQAIGALLLALAFASLMEGET